ncbi:MAG: NTP transferase domain-containing protein [Aeromicrobium erythreum]
MGELHGLVLAAGAGRRLGRPKATVVDADGEAWVARAVRVLREGGCDPVHVVLGADADTARALVPPDARVVVADDWAEGMSASLRAGLRAVAATTADAVMIHLVDLPDVGVPTSSRGSRHTARDPTRSHAQNFLSAPVTPC